MFFYYSSDIRNLSYLFYNSEQYNSNAFTFANNLYYIILLFNFLIYINYSLYSKFNFLSQIISFIFQFSYILLIIFHYLFLYLLFLIINSMRFMIVHQITFDQIRHLITVILAAWTILRRNIQTISYLWVRVQRVKGIQIQRILHKN